MVPNIDCPDVRNITPGSACHGLGLLESINCTNLPVQISACMWKVILVQQPTIGFDGSHISYSTVLSLHSWQEMFVNLLIIAVFFFADHMEQSECFS